MYKFQKIKHNVSRLLPDLTKKMPGEKDIVALYLFGSRARGKERETSDVDLAVLLDENISRECYTERRLELISLAFETLKTDEVDLVILNQVPFFLAYRVIAEGKLLYENSKKRGQRVSFEARTYDRYFDFQPLLKVQSEALKKRIREGKFGAKS